MSDGIVRVVGVAESGNGGAARKVLAGRGPLTRCRHCGGFPMPRFDLKLGMAVGSFSCDRCGAATRSLVYDEARRAWNGGEVGRPRAL
jgi:hypothetical protein